MLSVQKACTHQRWPYSFEPGSNRYPLKITNTLHQQISARNWDHGQIDLSMLQFLGSGNWHAECSLF
jgi:hypothetical protein